LIFIKATAPKPHQTAAVNEQPLFDPAVARIISLAPETQFAPNGIVSRTLWRAPGSRVVLFGFAAGQELSEHTSTQHALIQVLSGECDFALKGKWHRLKPGDLLSMPPHTPHAVRAVTQFSMLLTLLKPSAEPRLPAAERAAESATSAPA
jgi:quercetin dioxygenase-like cupin family protein